MGLTRYLFTCSIMLRYNDFILVRGKAFLFCLFAVLLVNANWVAEWLLYVYNAFWTRLWNNAFFSSDNARFLFVPEMLEVHYIYQSSYMYLYCMLYMYIYTWLFIFNYDVRIYINYNWEENIYLHYSGLQIRCLILFPWCLFLHQSRCLTTC